jgi:Holliday junction resolvasome RuvABC ATP-dependent DNA helicase subunit
MTRHELIAQALVSWLTEALKTTRAVSREGLPRMDVAHFFTALGRIADFPAEEFSIALVDFGPEATDLRALADAHGLSALREIAGDLNAAGAWRNDRKNHPRIIALARGRHPGVHTLKHFSKAKSRDLATALLKWAADEEMFTGGIGAQRTLLTRLADSPQVASLRSLEAAADFLAAWLALRAERPNDAPRLALTELGLLADPQLFRNLDELELRLVRNGEITQLLLNAPPYQFAKMRERMTKYRSATKRDSLVAILDKVEALRRSSTNEQRGVLSLDEAEMLLRPPKDDDEPDPGPEAEPVDGPEPEDAEPDEEFDRKDLARATADALLFDRREELEEAADAMEEALTEALARDKEEVTGQVPVKDEQRTFSFKLDPGLLKWLNTFCSETAWGGLVDSLEPTLALALANHSAGKFEILGPDAVAQPDERPALGMPELLHAWDTDLAGAGIPDVGLAQRWERFAELRGEIAKHVDALVHLPSTWLAGKPQLVEAIAEYLGLAAAIYHRLQRHYRDMAECSSRGWAGAAIEAMLALDVVQVRVDLGDGREAHKAVLLPTHPLHLWRRQRLTAVLRGLGDHIEQKDREAILKDSLRPEHFLSVLAIGSIPAGRGVNQILPVANDLHGLATFENLINAYSGPDGAATLAYAVDRFAVLGRYHARPLRLVIINPPEPGQLLAKLVQVLKKRRSATLPTLRIELFATTDHGPRVQAALRFSGVERELLEDQIASGRLEFEAHEKPRKLGELLAELKARPCHVLALFDEATIRIRRRGAGRNLPMSPFCVQHHIEFDKRENVLRLVPDSDEPPFSDFMQLINEAQSGPRDSSPHAWADADSLRKVVDEVLQGDTPAAQWLFLADRALPAEAGMKSVRLLHKRDMQRQTLLAARDHLRLARLVRPIFDQCNLSLSAEQLRALLEEGVNLIGAGLLDLIRDDGKPDPGHVLGLAGALLAARDHRQRHPDALLVSVDDEVARLWLRLGRERNRCDLLAVRREGEGFIVESIEVKASEARDLAETEPDVRNAKVQIETTLSAVAAALPDTTAERDPLSAPRCEMLKEVLVRGCQSRAASPEKRALWSGWLKTLFRQETDEVPVVRCEGTVVRVLLRNNAPAPETPLATAPFSIVCRTLGEARIQELIESVAPMPSLRPTPTVAPSPTRVEPAHKPSTDLPITPPRRVALSAPRETSTAPPALAVTSPGSLSELPWPPAVNAIGMIGQAEAVAQLVSQVKFARAAGRRFPDKLLVGPAGVGKSSVARAIARQLLNEEELLFNGADLKSPTAIIVRLRERKKLPARPRGTARVERCLIFIDEVHAITGATPTTLLSALDDERTTTVDGVIYDFSDVIFILATTDPGKLSEAFNSRPDKTYLRPYTLDEMAGILWLHGQQNLDGFELPREVCVEIAARMRCNPRRAVRALTQTLIPHFHERTHGEGGAFDLHRIAEAMTQSAVAQYFDANGIDMNGLDSVGQNYLAHLGRNGATSEERLRQALGISNKGDFIEVDEYLTLRLGLVSVSSAGRTLTKDGRRYLASPFDLRERISRQR